MSSSSPSSSSMTLTTTTTTNDLTNAETAIQSMNQYSVQPFQIHSPQQYHQRQQQQYQQQQQQYQQQQQTLNMTSVVQPLSYHNTNTNSNSDVNMLSSSGADEFNGVTPTTANSLNQPFSNLPVPLAFSLPLTTASNPITNVMTTPTDAISRTRANSCIDAQFQPSSSSASTSLTPSSNITFNGNGTIVGGTNNNNNNNNNNSSGRSSMVMLGSPTLDAAVASSASASLRNIAQLEQHPFTPKSPTHRARRDSLASSILQRPPQRSVNQQQQQQQQQQQTLQHRHSITVASYQPYTTASGTPVGYQNTMPLSPDVQPTTLTPPVHSARGSITLQPLPTQIMNHPIILGNVTTALPVGAAATLPATGSPMLMTPAQIYINPAQQQQPTAALMSPFQMVATQAAATAATSATATTAASLPTSPIHPVAGMATAAGFPQMAIYTPATPFGQARLKLTCIRWDEENAECVQMDFNGHSVTRRLDNNMINGTKLLNVTGMTRGRRDGILKNEKERVVVKAGAMSLKGVWIPFERAVKLAKAEGIFEKLMPMFADDPVKYLTEEKQRADSLNEQIRQQIQQQHSVQQQPVFAQPAAIISPMQQAAAVGSMAAQPLAMTNPNQPHTMMINSSDRQHPFLVNSNSNNYFSTSTATSSSSKSGSSSPISASAIAAAGALSLAASSSASIANVNEANATTAVYDPSASSVAIDSTATFPSAIAFNSNNNSNHISSVSSIPALSHHSNSKSINTSPSNDSIAAFNTIAFANQQFTPAFSNNHNYPSATAAASSAGFNNDNSATSSAGTTNNQQQQQQQSFLNSATSSSILSNGLQQHHSQQQHQQQHPLAALELSASAIAEFSKSPDKAFATAAVPNPQVAAVDFSSPSINPLGIVTGPSHSSYLASPSQTSALSMTAAMLSALQSPRSDASSAHHLTSSAIAPLLSNVIASTHGSAITPPGSVTSTRSTNDGSPVVFTPTTDINNHVAIKRDSIPGPYITSAATPSAAIAMAAAAAAAAVSSASATPTKEQIANSMAISTLVDNARFNSGSPATLRSSDMNALIRMTAGVGAATGMGHRRSVGNIEAFTQTIDGCSDATGVAPSTAAADATSGMANLNKHLQYLRKRANTSAVHSPV